MSKTKAVLAGVAGTLLTLAAGLAIAQLAGYRLVIQVRGGTPTKSVMSFAPVAIDPDAVEDLDSVDGPQARNLILLIGDGMGFGQVLGARAALKGIHGRLTFESLPVTGWLTTMSADRLITDSGAGATALATGVKTDMRRLSVTPEGHPVRTILEAASAAGRSVGMVTDSYLWDATPAAFATHLESRRDYDGVARQMAESGFDLLIGEEDGGHSRDDAGGVMLEAFRGRGFQIVRDFESLAAADGRALLALFGPRTIARASSPRLAELTAFAVERLSRDADGFALLIETEEPDTASHNMEFERAVRGVGALDRAVEVAVDFARRDGHTLVVVTADHDTGGLALLQGRDGEPIRVRWSTSSHTGNPVPLFAYGPRAERLGGVRDNTEVPRILARLLELDLDAAPPATN